MRPHFLGYLWVLVDGSGDNLALGERVHDPLDRPLGELGADLCLRLFLQLQELELAGLDPHLELDRAGVAKVGRCHPAELGAGLGNRELYSGKRSTCTWSRNCRISQPLAVAADGDDEDGAAELRVVDRLLGLLDLRLTAELAVGAGLLVVGFEHEE